MESLHSRGDNDNRLKASDELIPKKLYLLSDTHKTNDKTEPTFKLLKIVSKEAAVYRVLHRHTVELNNDVGLESASGSTVEMAEFCAYPMFKYC